MMLLAQHREVLPSCRHLTQLYSAKTWHYIINPIRRMNVMKEFFYKKCSNEKVLNFIFSAKVGIYDHHSSSVVDYFATARGIAGVNNTTAYLK
jgi:hypothetical protein